MLLKALKERAKTKELPDFHSVQEVRYAIDLDINGIPSNDGVRELSDPDRPSRGIRLPIQSSSRTSGISPLPLDRGDYVLGIPTNAKTEEQRAKAVVRSSLAHDAYITLLKEAASETSFAPLIATHRFVRDVDPLSIKVPPNFDASRFVAIYVNGKLLSNEPAVQSWWIARCKGGAGDRLDRTCGVCGSPCTPVENIPIQIRGLTRIGGQATMALISGNAEVFERHGMHRATGASICLECGNSTHQMLNQLIASDTNSFSYGSGMFVWWSLDETDDIIGALLSGASEADVRDVLRSLLTGKRPDINLDAPFVGVTLGANASRVLIRTWLDLTVGQALSNVDDWFSRISVIGRDGFNVRHPSIFTLLASVTPPGQGSPLSRLRPDIVDAAIRAALSRQALPPMLLAHTLGRLRASGGEITAPIAALLKCCITPVNSSDPEAFMKLLDESSTDDAYLCGRLLALLDNAARLATSANNSLVDRSYSAASTMPLITFTRLLRLHRAHLEKLRRDKPGAASRINGAVTTVMERLQTFPKTLSVESQARFALGLYHQQAADRAAIQKAKEAKVLGDIATSVEDDEEVTN